ncbi:MAG: SpoVK/Ycf46/Vps4 family AAA+-type ATPase [Cognaticolwellia sp.]|jgi:SpoVK/Ycf46/Vps4 family AAA+-type ATPase
MAKKKDAIGGNYKLQHLKIFGSKENLFFNTKKYRMVFDEAECQYIYCEFAFYNKLFDEKEWDFEVKLVCTNTGNSEQLCELVKQFTVGKNTNIFNVREGWGTPASGWWKKGKYRWQIYMNDDYIGETFFYVIDGGLITADNNPYFKINHIKLFESLRTGMVLKDRTYYKTFGYSDTKYINIELELENLLNYTDNFPLELQFNFYNDAGQHKAFMQYFYNFTDNRETITMDSGYGADSGGYWYKDTYTLEVIFMDQLVAVIPFIVGDESIEQDGEYQYFVTQNRLTTTVEVAEEDKEKPTFEEAKQSLEDLIGLETVKTQINDIATYLQFIKIRKDKGFDEGQKINLNAVFMGNPGTGKTTVANLLGQIYWSLDLLSHGKVHEVGRADLVGEYIGQTAPKVKKAIEKARGGVLFIDEAYSLTNRGDDGKDFGKEVIEVLLTELSGGKGDLAIVCAGYPAEMSVFLNSNPGLASRLSNVIQFPDYLPDELMSIAGFASKKRDVLLSEEGEKHLHKKVVDLYRNRKKTFGNARLINGIIEESKQNMALRLMKDEEGIAKLTNDELSTIELKDIKKVFTKGLNRKAQIPIDDALLEDALTQLHDLIGLDSVKKEVEEMAKLARYYREIGKDVRKAFSLHTVFKGNPGTGKTSIARLIVQIYKGLGILERGHLIEVDRKDLVAAYSGQTAIKTNKMIEEAMGGGLFIDEAYSLTNSNDPYGKEVIETLLKQMEDKRGDFMVIVAGYPKEMDMFLEANPGLLSRFDKQFIFEDYDTPQLFEIAETLIEQEDLQLDDAAKIHIIKYIDKLVKTKHKYFGNARTIRKIVAQSVQKQHLRMAQMNVEERTEKVMNYINFEDVSEFNLLEQDVKDGIGFNRK